MRRGGFTYVEVLVAAALGSILVLVVQAFLVSGFSFALAAEADAAQASVLQAALDGLVREAQAARGHRVYQDEAACQAGSPLAGGLPGSCLYLVSSAGNAVYWLEGPSGELRCRRGVEAGEYRVLARGVVVFQVRCLQPDHLALLLQQQRPADSSDVPRPLNSLSTSVFHRNFDGTEDSCMLPVHLAVGGAGNGPW